MQMQVAPCTRCQHWSREQNGCTVDTGCEHLPEEPPERVPDCPIADRCQHQIQKNPAPCVVRARGMICESALRFAHVPDPEGHELAYNANTIASPEEWAERGHLTCDDDVLD